MNYNLIPGLTCDNISKRNNNRFVSYKDRDIRSDFEKETIKNISFGKYNLHWKGIQLMKDPMTLICYQQMFNDIQFGTVFELGSYEGGSALWFYDIIYNLYPHKSISVHSFDINLSYLKISHINERSNLNFHQLDTNTLSDNYFLNSPILNNYNDIVVKFPKPWLIIEDCHVNVVNSMSHFAKYCTKGDYIFIEDTNPLGPKYSCMNEDNYEEYGNTKLDMVKSFTDLYPNFLVDTYYTDMFGYNSTWQWNSILCYN